MIDSFPKMLAGIGKCEQIKDVIRSKSVLVTESYQGSMKVRVMIWRDRGCHLSKSY